MIGNRLLEHNAAPSSLSLVQRVISENPKSPVRRLRRETAQLVSAVPATGSAAERSLRLLGLLADEGRAQTLA